MTHISETAQIQRDNRAEGSAERAGRRGRRISRDDRRRRLNRGQAGCRGHHHDLEVETELPVDVGDFQAGESIAEVAQDLAELATGDGELEGSSRDVTLASRLMILTSVCARSSPGRASPRCTRGPLAAGLSR